MSSLPRNSCLAIVFSLLGFSLALTPHGLGQNQKEAIILPTVNDYLFKGQGEKFYMYVYRNFEGRASKPWTAGKYGFVRNLRRTDDGVIGTKFHEGIDIRPIRRDRSGRPVDEVKAVASGVVAYANSSSSRSNYGKYIVVEHGWECGPIYSLYAHLSEVNVKAGQSVAIGESIGKVGYTGVGINRERAHLHLELDLLLSTRFTEWHKKHMGGTNYHGNHNGINMAGLDIAAYFMAKRRNQQLTIPEYLKSVPVHYKVTVTRDQKSNAPLEIVSRYPWLARGDHNSRTPSWEISFSASGFPLSVNPSNRIVTSPRISSIRKCRSKHEYHTKGFVSGTGYRATLSKTGRRFIELVTGQF